MKRVLWSIFALSLLLAGCDRSTEETADSTEIKQKSRTVYTHSIGDMEKVFDDINYSLGEWVADRQVIPRVYLTDISSRWGEQAQTLSVEMKKSIFFQMILPLVLLSNEELRLQRQRVENLAKKKHLSTEESVWLRKTARQYKLLKGGDKIDRTVIDALLRRVNIIPPSLALAQAAKESGWGTSRFSLMGNSLFGQWDLSGNGMVPAQQRKELGTYGLASFETPFLAVKSYMANLNTHPAYRKFRVWRARQASKGEHLRGTALVATLDRYSEQGQAYVDDLRDLMNYNRLAQTDLAKLSDDETVYLTPVTDPEEIVDKRMKRLLAAAKVTKPAKKSVLPLDRTDDQYEENTSSSENILIVRDDTNGSEKLDSSAMIEVVEQEKRVEALKKVPALDPEKRSSKDRSALIFTSSEDNDTSDRIPWEWESNTTITPWTLSDD